MIVASTAACLLVLALAMAFVRFVRTDRLTATLRAPAEIGGIRVTVPELLWHLTDYGEAPDLRSLTRSARRPDELAPTLQEHVGTLPEAARTAVAARSLRRQRAAFESAVLTAQLNALPRAAAVGALDGASISLGQQYDAAVSLFERATESIDPADVGSLLSGAILAKTHLPTPDVVSEWVSAYGAVAAEAGAELAADGVEALAGVLDSGIPFASIGMAVHRAVKQKRAGLNDERVRENLALDAGVRGSAVAIGAAAGTAILPVVGTVIGGLIGGMLGGGVAKNLKERHLQRAHDDFVHELGRLGADVDPSAWVRLTRDMAGELRYMVDARNGLQASIKRLPLRSRLMPAPAYVAARLAAELADQDISRFRHDVDSFRSALETTSTVDEAWRRGCMVLARPDIAVRLGIDEAAVARANNASAAVDDERRKLALA